MAHSRIVTVIVTHGAGFRLSSGCNPARQVFMEPRVLELQPPHNNFGPGDANAVGKGVPAAVQFREQLPLNAGHAATTDADLAQAMGSEM